MLCWFVYFVRIELTLKVVSFHKTYKEHQIDEGIHFCKNTRNTCVYSLLQIRFVNARTFCFLMQTFTCLKVKSFYKKKDSTKNFLGFTLISLVCCQTKRSFWPFLRIHEENFQTIYKTMQRVVRTRDHINQKTVF